MSIAPPFRMKVVTALRAAASLLAARDAPWVYHVTFYGRLEAIVEEGLRPNEGGSSWGQYASHSKGRVFFTTGGGVATWMHKLHYSGASDEGIGGLTVVLRVRADRLQDAGRDHIGTRDAMNNAYVSQRVVPPARLQVWTGKRWQDLEDADLDAMAAFARSKAEKDPDSSYEPLEDETEDEWQERTASMDQDDDNLGYWFDEDTFEPPKLDDGANVDLYLRPSTSDP